MDDPRPPGCVKLAGDMDLWRIRVGVYGHPPCASLLRFSLGILKMLPVVYRCNSFLAKAACRGPGFGAIYHGFIRTLQTHGQYWIGFDDRYSLRQTLFNAGAVAGAIFGGWGRARAFAVARPVHLPTAISKRWKFSAGDAAARAAAD